MKPIYSFVLAHIYLQFEGKGGFNLTTCTIIQTRLEICRLKHVYAMEP